MSWWTAVAGLTPVAAWDASSFNSTKLLDLVGSNNMTFSGAEASPLFYKQFSGNENPWPLDASISLPTDATIMGFVRHSGRGLMFYKTLGDGNSYFMDQESNQRMYQYANGSGGDVGVGPDWNVWKFMALVKDASNARLYINGAWAGSQFTSSWVPDSIGGVGYYANGNEYNLGSGERFSAAGVWSGVATLAELQVLEAAVRSELAGPPVGAFSAPLGATRSINNPLALNPGPPPNFSASLKYSWKNIYQGGNGTIQGTTTIENIPGSRQVRLYDKRSGLLVAETWSSPTGHYEFNNIDSSKEYFVVAHDHLRVYNGVISDMLKP